MVGINSVVIVKKFDRMNAFPDLQINFLCYYAPGFMQ